MERLARQVVGFDAASLISIIWLAVLLGVVFWFYQALKRIENAILDVKKLLEARTHEV